MDTSTSTDMMRIRNLIYNGLLYKNLAPVFRALSSEGHKYAVIKGEPLSVLNCGDIGYRKSSDIDILVSKETVKVLENLLIRQDFYLDRPIDRKARALCIAYSHQLPPYKKIIGNISLFVDINFDILWGEYGGTKLDISEFLSDTVPMTLYGVEIQTLTPVKTLIQLCLHHYKEMNSLYHLYSHNPITTANFHDISKLLNASTFDIDLQTCFELCEKYHISKYIYYILFYTSILYQNKRTLEFVRKFSSYHDDNLLNSYGLSKSEKKTWLIPFEKRLNHPNLMSYVRKDLTDQDKQKIHNNQLIFG